MNAQIHRRTMMAISIFVAILVIVYIYVFEPESYGPYLPVGINDFRERDTYEIDPITILTAIDRGEIDVFKPKALSQQNPLKEFETWQQTDFIKVARTLNQSLSKEPLSAWRLYSMHFSTPCKDNPSGFAEADFYYFKTTFRDNGKIRYVTQNFFISPEYGEVSWAGGANFPHPLFGWKNIRLSQIQITAEDALAIAEENGGKETRQLVDNKCRIHARLAGDDTWQILIYQNDTGSSLFRMVIDPRSGTVE